MAPSSSSSSSSSSSRKERDCLRELAVSVSKHEFLPAGIITTVYGLDELPPGVERVACLWLFHGRGADRNDLGWLASTAVTTWNRRRSRSNGGDGDGLGLIAVCFDQRNHGSRLVDAKANGAWTDGNQTHAPDMFGHYNGTARDCSNLITALPFYLFPPAFPSSKEAPPRPTLSYHLVLGVSLGGHTAWHSILHDPRISAGVVVIGCPDYVRLMCHRAENSKRPSWTDTDPPGSEFLGSRDFPPALLRAVQRFDPAGLFLTAGGGGEREGHGTSPTAVGFGYETAPENKKPDRRWAQLRLLQRTLDGKRILNMAGGADPLVPYKCARPWLDWLKDATGPDGWAKEYVSLDLEDVVFDGVGHTMTPPMSDKALEFICDTLENVEKKRNRAPKWVSLL